MERENQIARVGAYKVMLALSVASAYADQFFDFLFVADLMSADKTGATAVGGAAMFFVLLFGITSGVKAVGDGRGLLGFVLAATGIDVGWRAFRACKGSAADVLSELDKVAAHFAAESAIEGIPTAVLAFSWMYVQTNPCQFVTCDPATILATFPEYVLTLPASNRAISAAEVTALQSSGCSDLPLTSDAWFTLPHDLGARGQDLPGRSSGVFERVIEFQIDGVTGSNGTDVTTDTFACVGWSSPDPHHWLGLFQVPPLRDAWIPVLSAALGILASAYHLTRTYTTDASASLWALPSKAGVVPGKDMHARAVTTASMHAPDAADTSDGLPRPPELVGMPTEDSLDVSTAAAATPDAAFHEEKPQVPPGRRDPASPAVGVPLTAGAAAGARCVDRRPGSSGSAHSMRSTRGVRLDAAPQLLYHGAVYVCFVVDVTFALHLWWQLVALLLFTAPHLSLHVVLILGLIALAAVRALVITGTGSRRAWLSAWGQLLWAAAPIPVTSRLLLRAAPRCARYASVALSVACSAALQAMITLVALLCPRADGGYYWRSSWRRMTTSWVMLAMHAALACGIFAAQHRIAGRRGSRVAPCGRGSAAGGGHGGSAPDGAGREHMEICAGEGQHAAVECCHDTDAKEAVEGGDRDTYEEQDGQGATTP